MASASRHAERSRDPAQLTQQHILYKFLKLANCQEIALVLPVNVASIQEFKRRNSLRWRCLYVMFGPSVYSRNCHDSSQLFKIHLSAVIVPVTSIVTFSICYCYGYQVPAVLLAICSCSFRYMLSAVL